MGMSLAVISCGGEDDDAAITGVNEVLSPSLFDKYKIISDKPVESVGVGRIANDTSKIAILGLYDNNLVVAIFDAKTAIQQQIFYGNNAIVKEITTNVGYGAKKTYFLDNINSSNIYLTEKGCISCTYSYCGEQLYPDYYLATIDFFAPDNVKSIEAHSSDIGFAIWFDGTYLVRNSDYKSLNLKGLYTCYDICGNEIFSENTSSLAYCFGYQGGKHIPYKMDECLYIDVQSLPSLTLRKVSVFESFDKWRDIEITPSDDGRDSVKFNTTDYSNGILSLNIEITDWNSGLKTNKDYKISTDNWILLE